MGAFKDLTGQMINNWLIIEHKGFDKHGASIWLCECQCYKKTRRIKNISQLRKSKTCGCNNLPDLTNETFGRWFVLKWIEKDMWQCQCNCSKETIKIIDGRRLRSGTSQSCGCLTYESCKKYNSYDLNGDYGLGYTTNGNIEFLFDLEDYEKIKNTTWTYSTDKYIVGSSGEYSNKRMHRILFDGIGDDQIIDHCNRNKCDNRKLNLRVVTNQENSFNGSLRSNNKSGFIGVCWWNRDNNWMAQIKHNYKRYFLGYFDNLEDAIKARLEAELKYFGKEYAPQRHMFEKYGIGGDING